MLEVDELTVGDAPTEPPDAVKGPLRDVATQLEAMSAGQVAEMVGICRTQKAFSKPGEHKKAKLVDHVVPRQQDGGGSTRESLGDQRRRSETRNPSQGSACASVASQVGRVATVWLVQSSGQRVGGTEKQEGDWGQSFVEGGKHVQSQSSGQLFGEGERHSQSRSSGQVVEGEWDVPLGELVW